MPFVFQEDALTLNKFLDAGEVFIQSFRDSRRYRRAARVIVRLLLENRDLHHQSPDHPFNRFGDWERTRRQNIQRLSDAVMEEIQDTNTRSIVRSFFSINGSCREDFDILFDAFLDFVDESLDDGGDNEGNDNNNVGGQGNPIIIE